MKAMCTTISDKVLFASAHPFIELRDALDAYAAFPFTDEVRGKIMYEKRPQGPETGLAAPQRSNENERYSQQRTLPAEPAPRGHLLPSSARSSNGMTFFLYGVVAGIVFNKDLLP